MKNRRRRFIVEGNFQTRFMLRFVIIIIGATLLASAALLGIFFFKYQHGEADLSNLIILVSPEGGTKVSSLFQVVLIPVVVVNLLILCIVIPYSLVHSNNIAGPIYRFEQSLDNLLRGEMDFMVQLRKKDEFKYLASKMNALVDYMRRNIDEVRSSHRIIKERVAKIESLTKSGTLDVKGLRRELIELTRFFDERGKPFSY